MKTTYNWLKEYIDIKISPGKVADLLTMSGSTVTSLTNKDSDSVFEFEIMSNRPDCLSTVGIAREIAALTGKKIRMPDFSIAKTKESSKERLGIRVLDKNLCPRYTGRVVRNIRVKPSPEWLKSKILSIDLRPVNSIVDITNFCLFELGQPLHAFDLDRIKGDVSVRQAKEGEKITTIDGARRKLEKGTPVIADESGPIAIAGVMGGLDTEVTANTKNILLESAYFNPVSVRSASRKLGVGSPSSYRFERGVDRGMVLFASDRASSLILSVAEGELGELLDIGAKTAPAAKIKFDNEKSNRILGIEIKKNEVKKIFTGLGLGVKVKGGLLEVSVPSFRNDLKREIDLTEEAARIYGYDKIPLTIPRIVGNVETKDSMQILKDRVRQVLSGSGLNEIMTYSLTSKKTLKDLGIADDDLIVIKNPLSLEQEVLVPTLLPGMLNTMERNINRKIKNLSFFEVAKIYTKKKASCAEEETLSMGLTGHVFDSWNTGRKETDFFYLKGIAWNLFKELGVKDLKTQPHPIAGLSPDTSSYIKTSQDRVLGFMGRVNREQAVKYGVGQDIFFAQVYLTLLLDLAKIESRFKPLSRYPSVERDISILADKKVLSDEIIRLAKAKGKGIIKKVRVFDVYKGSQVPEGKKGLSIRVEYRDDAKTLKDEAVNALHEEVKKALSDELKVSFR